MENKCLSVRARVRNNVYSVTFTDKKSGLSFGVMSRNLEKVQKWLKNRLTK